MGDARWAIPRASWFLVTSSPSPVTATDGSLAGSGQRFLRETGNGLAGSGQLAADSDSYGKRETGNGKRATGNGQRETGNGRLPPQSSSNSQARLESRSRSKKRRR